MAVKIEVEFKIEEVKRYKIVRSFNSQNVGGYSSSCGFSGGHEYGEFQRKEDAERVLAALEADLGRKINSAL